MEISLSISFRKRNILKIDTPFGTLARQVETLASRLASKQACWHVNHAGAHARWHACTYDTRFSKLVFNNFFNGVHERDKHLGT